MSERDPVNEIINQTFPAQRRDVAARFVREALKVDGVTQIVAVDLGSDKLAPQPSILVISDKGLAIGTIPELRKSVCPDSRERDWVLGLVVAYTAEGFKEELPAFVQLNHQITVLWQRP